MQSPEVGAFLVYVRKGQEPLRRALLRCPGDPSTKARRPGLTVVFSTSGHTARDSSWSKAGKTGEQLCECVCVCGGEAAPYSHLVENAARLFFFLVHCFSGAQACPCPPLHSSPWLSRTQLQAQCKSMTWLGSSFRLAAQQQPTHCSPGLVLSCGVGRDKGADSVWLRV